MQYMHLLELCMYTLLCIISVFVCKFVNDCQVIIVVFKEWLSPITMQ